MMCGRHVLLLEGGIVHDRALIDSSSCGHVNMRTLVNADNAASANQSVMFADEFFDEYVTT